MKIIALIQARLGSTRLPAKNLMLLHGRPLIDWVVERVKQARLLDMVVLAIPDSPDNDLLAEHLRTAGHEIFRGSEQDVLQRMYGAAKSREADVVVRVCADNPLICGSEIDALIRFWQENSCDYAYNHIPRNNMYPDGLGAEICSFALLEQIFQEAQSAGQREHCFNYIWDNPSRFSIRTFDPADPALHRPDIKLDVDTPEDLQALQALPLFPEMTAQDIVRLF